ncbi:uncharacterized protein sync [Cyprinodon tularosa]|uniref:uncharacterized protein sync n=1 Tax=Cyprinodon tularosa TaxID=77115 RepID=UPI0018E2392E|nr:uncharacterized protein sync [Cyprinodon tularosa]
MEDQEEDISTTCVGPLFIREEKADTDRTIVEQSDGNQNPAAQSFTGKPLHQPALSEPYLQEMDVLLKSCEKLTGIPFRSRHIEGYSETSLSKSGCIKGKEKSRTETHEEACMSTQASRSSFYIDTQMDATETEDELAESQNLGTVIHKPGSSCHSDMPLSSAGSELSASMLEYEDQLLRMLAMLESCMEETGMDFESQEQTTDACHEYMHIKNTPYHYMDKALTLDALESPALPPMHNGSNVEGDKASEDGGIEEAMDSAGKENSQNNMVDYLKQRPEGHLVVGHDVQNPDLMISELEEAEDQSNQETMTCKGINIGHIPNEEPENMADTAGIGTDDVSLAAERKPVSKADLESDMTKLSSQMDDCIEEVQRLEKRRKELLLEVLQLRGPKIKDDVERGGKDEEEMEEWIDTTALELITVLKKEEEARREERKKEIHSLREERADEERKTWKVNLERQGLQDELRRLRRWLFAAVRECAQSQATLNNQRCDFELLRTEEEKLNSLVLQLAEESCQLRSAHQEQLLELNAKLHHQTPGETANAQEELTECRKNSCGDVQQYVQGGLKALEDRYEPILVALLKRKEATADALTKSKNQSHELKVQVKPLMDEIQKLELERTCLEERLKLTHMQRQEDASRYKEAIHFLEESIRELRTELEIQKRKTKDMEEMRESLTKQLLLYRIASEDHNSCEQDKT